MFYGFIDINIVFEVVVFVFFILENKIEVFRSESIFLRLGR